MNRSKCRLQCGHGAQDTCISWGWGSPRKNCTFGGDLRHDQTRQGMITVNIKLARLEYVRYLETHVGVCHQET